MTPKKVSASELQLGDVVRVTEGEYSTATVYRLVDGAAQVWRPYVAVSDFSYTGGVIPTIGIEDFTLRGEVTLLRRLEVPLR